MKRRNFLKATMVIAPLVTSTPVLANVGRAPKGFIVKAGEGRYHGHIKLKGVNSNILDVKISGRDTNGDLAVFEQTSISPKRGTPLHVHSNQDEMFHVQDGEYLFLVGQDKF